MDDTPLYFIHNPRQLNAQDMLDKFGITLNEVLQSQRDFKVSPRTAEDGDDYLLRLICRANDREQQTAAGDVLDRACARLGIVRRRARETASPKRGRMFGIDLGDVSGDATEILLTMRDGSTHKILGFVDKYWFDEATDFPESDFLFVTPEHGVTLSYNIDNPEDFLKLFGQFPESLPVKEVCEPYSPDVQRKTSKKHKGQKWKR